MRKRYTGKEKAPINAAEPVIQNEKTPVFQNGLNDVLGLNNNPWSAPLSQADSLFLNNRWYLVSNMRQLLSEMFVEHGVIQTAVSIPVDDGLRGGIQIKSKQLSEDQIQEVKIYMDRQNDMTNLGWTMKWNRLFGGAGLVMITGQDPLEPFDMTKLDRDSLFELRPSDMWELFYDQQNTEGYIPQIQAYGFEYYSYYSKRLHKSFVMPMKGMMAPSFIRPRLRGWGFSIVETMVRAVNQYLKATNLSYEVLDEFKLDVFKFKNLASTLGSPQGQQNVMQRVDIANRQKNYQNAIVLDSEDDYDHKQLSFAGLDTVMAGIRMQLASELKIPMSKLFGIASSGFSSGEDDIENYNAMIESEIRTKCKYDIVKLVEVRCQMLFGFVPDDIEIEFKPLRVLSAEQEENVKTQKFNRILAAQGAGAINQRQFNEACNRDNLLGIQLETDPSLIEQDQAEVGGKPEIEEEEEEVKPTAAKGGKSVTQAPEAKT